MSNIYNRCAQHNNSCFIKNIRYDIYLSASSLHAIPLFVSPCNWDIIRKIKSTISIPVVANGGIACRDDALRQISYLISYILYEAAVIMLCTSVIYIFYFYHHMICNHYLYNQMCKQSEHGLLISTITVIFSLFILLPFFLLYWHCKMSRVYRS